EPDARQFSHLQETGAKHSGPFPTSFRRFRFPAFLRTLPDLQPTRDPSRIPLPGTTNREGIMPNVRIWLQGGLLLGAVTVALADSGFLPNLFPFQDPSGKVETFSTTGKVDLTGPFFQILGSRENGRSCASCHQASDAWSVSAAHVAQRFEDTQGMDPIFRPNDGSNCDHNIDVSTLEGRRQAYSLLISRGLIRVVLPIPDGAEFEVVS